MTTKTKEIETIYGTLEVETVECDSCGNVINEEEAKEFTIGDREGWACEICYDEGPIEFPMGGGSAGPILIGSVIFAPIMLLLLTIDIRDVDGWRLEDVCFCLGVAIGTAVYTVLIINMFV